MPPTTQKQIREVAYKKLEELQEKLDKLTETRASANRATFKELSTLLLEARAQLQLTVNQ